MISEVLSSKDKKLDVMVENQLALLKNIIETKKLNITLNELAKNTVIAAFDELAEYMEALDVFSEKLIADISPTDVAMELIDLLHFLVQLLIVGVMKKKHLEVVDLFKAGVSEEVTKEASAMLNEYIENIDSVEYESFMREILFGLSAVMKSLPWKHWKTYRSDPFNEYDFFGNVLAMIAITLKEISLYHEGDIIKGALLLYAIKNEENFRRQQNGY